MPPDSRGHNIRVRSHDEMDTASKTVAKRRQCRKTLKIDNCVFRCDQFHTKEDLTNHSESGILKRAGTQQDVHYIFTWQEKPAVTFRQEQQPSKEQTNERESKNSSTNIVRVSSICDND